MTEFFQIYLVQNFLNVHTYFGTAQRIAPAVLEDAPHSVVLADHDGGAPAVLALVPRLCSQMEAPPQS